MSAPYGLDDLDLQARIYALRRDVRLRDARPNDGRCGNVAAAISDALGWEQKYGYLHLLDGTVSWVHCWNKLPDGTLVDATADQFGELWLGDVVAIPPSDPHAARYRHAPEQWELRFERQESLAIACSSQTEQVTVRAEISEKPWLALAEQVLVLLTGWHLHGDVISLAARTLRAKAASSDVTTTEALIRPLVTEHIEHLARHRGQSWVGEEFSAPL